jgi:hypothetical protein
MTRYNHFKDIVYPKIMFSDLNIGDEFRYGRYKNGRHGFVIAIKTGELTFTEKRSKEEHHLLFVDANYIVYGLNCIKPHL